MPSYNTLFSQNSIRHFITTKIRFRIFTFCIADSRSELIELPSSKQVGKPFGEGSAPEIHANPQTSSPAAGPSEILDLPSPTHRHRAGVAHPADSRGGIVLPPDLL